jgi:hypothetical protein
MSPRVLPVTRFIPFCSAVILLCVSERLDVWSMHRILDSIDV